MMALYTHDQVPVREHRPSVSVSLLSTVARRRALIPRLHAAGIAGHVLLLQSDREDVPPPPGTRVLPPVRGPLLLDTRGMSAVMQARVLDELVTHHPTVPTLLLTLPTDRRLHRLAPSCSAVYAVVSDDVAATDLALWLRHPGVVGRARHPQVLPAYVGIPAPPRPLVDPRLLSLLVALAQAPTIDRAAKLGVLPERSFYRKLAELRTALRLPSRLYRGRASVLLQTILDALAVVPEREVG
ncbi:MAG TPA: hypothetical protein VFZ66_27345 [Herpetosiphonaceae bacterium]